VRQKDTHADPAELAAVCMSVRTRMLTVDVVSAMSALSMVRIATRRILGFLNDDVKIGQTNSIVRKTLRKRS
jgi:hypothetical protein